MLNRASKAGLLVAGLTLFFGKLLYDMYSGMVAPLPFNVAADLLNHIWPFYTYTSDSVQSGFFPLWNTNVATGNSLVGELGIGLFHPPNWTIFFIDDTAIAMLVSQLLIIGISLTGADLYARHLELAWSARVLCVALFGYAAALESFSQTGGGTSCWLPFIMYFTHRYFDRPTLANALCISGALAMSFFGGFANYFLYSCLIVGVYFSSLTAFSWRQLRPEELAQRFGLMALSVVLMVGFIAIQLLPAAELSALAVRDLNSTSVYSQSSTWEQVSASLVFANFLLADHNFAFGNSLLKVDVGLLYLGGALTLIPFSFRTKRYRATATALAASGLVIFGLVVSADVSALSFVNDIPVVGSLRLHSRGITYVQFIAILLAVLGAASLSSNAEQPASDRPVAKIFWMLFPIVFATGICVLAIMMSQNTWSTLGLLSCSVLVIYHAIFSSRIRRPATLAWVIITVIIIDISIHREHRYVVPAFSNEGNDLVEESLRDYRTRGDRFRTLLVPRTFAEGAALPNSGMTMGIPNISAYDNLTLARWRNFIRAMVGEARFDQLVANSVLQLYYGDLSPPLMNWLFEDDRIPGLASLRYVYSGEGITINENALPRAYTVHRYINTDTEEQSLAAIKANIAMLHEAVVLESATPSFASGDSPTAGSQTEASVVITRYTPNEVALSVETTQPAIVVLTDAFFPGWTASVSGVDTTIFRANSVFRAIEVPAGSHSVVFRYRPSSFYWGAAISFTSACLAFLLLLGSRYRRANTL